MMRERGLQRRFEGAVERAAGKARARGLHVGDGGPQRRDLRELATFTVDPASARDFDDAISAEWIEGARAVRVWVHIADVSAYVREGSPVDLEARTRGTSVYVPGAVEPMLPHALSGDACSLVPGRDRLAVTVEMEIALGGAPPAEPSFYRSLIRSDKRLDYERVDRIFAESEAAAEPWGEALRAARAAAHALGHARAARPGNLVVDSVEPEFEFDERGEVAAILARPQTESHRLIEHLMIAANEAVAQALQRNGVPCLYRVHERPRVESVERLGAQLATLDVPTPPVPDGLSRAQAAELVGEISRRVEEHVQRTIERARAGDPLASPAGGRRALSSLVLRSLQQAYYAPGNLGHAGLGSACYCHFTSPIRRYPDIVCHRALLSMLGHAEHAPRAGSLPELGAWCSERERAAMEIERDGDDIARCFALERVLYREGAERTFVGEVVGLIAAGAFVAFGARPAHVDDDVGGFGYEGMLPVRLLASAGLARDADAAARAREQRAVPVSRAAPRAGRRQGKLPGENARDWWELGEEGTILRGQRSGATLRLGDPIAVRVERVDAPRGRVDLVPAESEQPSRSPGSDGGPQRRRRGG
jgi:ribonuclease R